MLLVFYLTQIITLGAHFFLVAYYWGHASPVNFRIIHVKPYQQQVT